jgi:hypothetical protein
MFSTLLVATALTVGQTGELEISNPRPTYGRLGAVRPKGKGILPGDVACFTFDIKNLKLDDKGRASYSVAIEVKNSKGEIAYQQQPNNAVAQSFFGGNSMPCTAEVEIPLDALPGEHSWKITIEDLLAKKSAMLEGKGNVLEPDFGIIRVGTFADAQGRFPEPPIGVTGETLYVSFAAVGFARDPKTKQPDLAVKMRILDGQGNATTPQPLSGNVRKDIPEDLKIIPLQFAIAMNRPGRYTIELSARCERCEKTVTVTFPVRILEVE